MSLTEEMLKTCLTTRRLSLILLPTEACNLRCVYCYAESNLGQMEPSVLSGVKNFIRRRAANLDELDISWFGGEPLVAMPVVRDVQRYVASLIRIYPGLRFSSDMTTNAYLLIRPVFSELLDLGVTGYQISFDGPRQWHDQRRVMIGGGATFDRIWHNVSALKDESRTFKVIVRVHVDKENADSIPEFIEMYRNTFGGDPRFELFLRALSRLGSPNDESLNTLEGGLEDERIRELRALARVQKIAISPENASISPCYATRANSFVIRADGRINKCSIVLEDDGNQVGRLVEDGTMQLSTPRMLAWMRGLNSGSKTEMECPLKGFQDPGADV